MTQARYEDIEDQDHRVALHDSMGLLKQKPF